jgi:hypothetical protein
MTEIVIEMSDDEVNAFGDGNRALEEARRRALARAAAENKTLDVAWSNTRDAKRRRHIITFTTQQP